MTLEKNAKKAKSFQLFGFLNGLDMFGAPVPGLNVQGKAVINTSLGTLISIVVFLLTLLFSLFKLQHMLMKKNPSVSVVV